MDLFGPWYCVMEFGVKIFLRRCGALVAAAVTATVVNPGTAAAIDQVPCSSDEFVRVRMHFENQKDREYCYANGGEEIWNGRWWVTQIWTGNNRVQWFGDSRWQPSQPINKWTLFRWPNHPGGVRINGIRIV